MSGIIIVTYPLLKCNISCINSLKIQARCPGHTPQLSEQYLWDRLDIHEREDGLVVLHIAIGLESVPSSCVSFSTRFMTGSNNIRIINK